MFHGTRLQQAINAGRGMKAESSDYDLAVMYLEDTELPIDLAYSCKQVAHSYSQNQTIDRFHIEKLRFHRFNRELDGNQETVSQG